LERFSRIRHINFGSAGACGNEISYESPRYLIFKNLNNLTLFVAINDLVLGNFLAICSVPANTKPTYLVVITLVSYSEGPGFEFQSGDSIRLYVIFLRSAT
jgi:hypothetical protein